MRTSISGHPFAAFHAVNAAGDSCFVAFARALDAVRVSLLSPGAMLKRLGDRLKFLTGGARDVPRRQQTLGNTLVWSHELLEAGERALFARLAVFAGGF